MISRAMVLAKFKEPLEMREFDIPRLSDGEVLVKMDAAGICGSDVHMWKGEDPRTPLPIILGHEGVGTVIEVKGSKSCVDGRGLKEGDRILWNRGIACCRCYNCKVLKDTSLCTDRKVYGINISCSTYPYLNGCYSEYIILRENTDIFKVDVNIDPSVLVSASCSGATIAHAFDMIKDCMGATVVVQGPGPLGIYAIAFAKNLGASNIVIIGGSKSRLELCREFGATHILDRHSTTIEERRQAIFDLTGGRGADIAIEAVGIKGSAEEGLKHLRIGGTYLSTGYAQPAGIDQVDFFSDVVRKNVTIHGVWVSDTSHTYKAMNLVLRNKELFAKMITHKFTLERANGGLEVMNRKEALKAVLTF